MRAGWLLVVACMTAGVPAAARGRLARMLDARHGLQAPAITSLAQDQRGFIWIGSVGGLVRYDGQEARRIAPDVLATQINQIRPAGEVLFVRNAGGDVFRVASELAAPLPGPDGRPLVEVDDLWVEPSGALWTVGDHVIRRRDPDGRWSEPLGRLAGARIVRGGAGTLYVASRTVVWRIDGTRAVPIGRAERIIDVLPAADGSLYVLESHGHVWRIAGGAMTEVYYLDTRAITLAQRGTTIWIVYDSALVALAPNAPPDVMRRADGITSAEAILVDREGSLWLGTSSGVQQFPEPDTAVWDAPHGLPASPRYVVETPEGIWVPSWSGLGRIDRATGTAEDTGRDVRGGVCVDGAGHLWGGDARGFIERVDGAWVEYPSTTVLPNPCDTGPGGRVWFASRDGIYATRASGAPEHIADPPATRDLLDTVHEDHHGRVWVSARELVCWAKLGEEIAWHCSRIAGAVALDDFEETEAGTLWAATEQAGVQRWNEASATWEPIAPSLHLPSRVVLGLAPSPRGGMWVLGHGIVLRVRETAAGWQVLEAPSSWNGLASVDGLDALETHDGTLWIAGLGVTQMPSHVRGLLPPAPPVTLTDVRVDGEPADPARVLELPYGRNLLQLGFAALSYRDPALVQYRVRLAAGDPWSEPIRRPALQLAEISAGKHVAEVSASLDGTTWSAPTVLVFEVRGPLWREPWVIAAFVLAVALLGFAIYRIRVAMQLRLERQRVHIAMDLHDEMGSGLGSIGILAALATNDELPAAKRRTVAAEIIDAAEDLGESLGDIVWSLRRGSNTLDALAAHILERAARLVPEGALVIALPTPVPPVALSLVVCRSLQLVCFEALHNAARHAHANHVTFGLARVDRQRWRFTIEDDGIGLAGERTKRPGSGLGLTSMQSRADEIGAELAISARPGGGTCVAVTFLPGTPERARRGAA